MDTRGWAKFELDSRNFEFAGERLKSNWPKLHAGDREPFPDVKRIEGVLEAHPELGEDAENIAAGLQAAWRFFHAGEFAEAVNQASRLGLIAHAVANKSAGIYADYLEEDDDAKQAIYKHCIRHAEAAIKAIPEDPNAHYFHAYALGRYSQCISVARALSEGLGGKIHDSLEAALELEPQHAEGHTAMGVYHAEVISKVGKLVGSLTYGASTEKAIEHFETAIKLSNAPIAHIEYGNGLYLLYGDKELEASNAAYRKASEIKPIDAMQALDVAYAQASLA